MHLRLPRKIRRTVNYIIISAGLVRLCEDQKKTNLLVSNYSCYILVRIWVITNRSLPNSSACLHVIHSSRMLVHITLLTMCSLPTLWSFFTPLVSNTLLARLVTSIPFTCLYYLPSFTLCIAFTSVYFIP